MAIKEFFLLKVSAALKVGPEVKPYQGFDVIVYQNCAQISLELCEEVKQLSSWMKDQLSLNMLLMHKFGLVHFDIKPDNIMKSYQFEKIVFIDFGLSTLTNKQVGEKEEVYFQGTLSYCSPQMAQCFQDNHPQKVDVFFNDVYAMKETFNWYAKNSFLDFEENP